jgi:hypothetical protein
MAGDHGMGGVEALGGPDGLWIYSSDKPDRANSIRRFSTQPRMGAPAVPSQPVRLDPDGRLRIGQGEPANAAIGYSASDTAAAEVLAELAEAGNAGLTTTQVTAGGGEVGVLRRMARDRLAKEGAIVSRHEGRSIRWWAAEFAPPA